MVPRALSSLSVEAKKVLAAQGRRPLRLTGISYGDL